MWIEDVTPKNCKDILCACHVCRSRKGTYVRKYRPESPNAVFFVTHYLAKETKVLWDEYQLMMYMHNPQTVEYKYLRVEEARKIQENFRR